MKRDLIYVELKSGHGHTGPAWIGFAGSSKSGATIYFDGKSFKSLKGMGISANFYDAGSGDEYWISGIKKNGQDRHWAGGGKVEIDAAAIGQYLAAMGLSKLPGNIVPTKLAPSEFSQKHHEMENETLDDSEEPELGSDPRNRRFYNLKKKDPSQLSVMDISELMTMCDEMMKFVTDKQGRKSWKRYRAELSELLKKF